MIDIVPKYQLSQAEGCLAIPSKSSQRPFFIFLFISSFLLFKVVFIPSAS